MKEKRIFFTSKDSILWIYSNKTITNLLLPKKNSLRFSKERPQNVEYGWNGAVRNTKIDRQITHGRFEFWCDSSIVSLCWTDLFLQSVWNKISFYLFLKEEELKFSVFWKQKSHFNWNYPIHFHCNNWPYISFCVSDFKTEKIFSNQRSQSNIWQMTNECSHLFWKHYHNLTA